MSKRHDPSEARAIARAAKDGEPLAGLLTRAQAIEQAYHRALALAALGAHQQADPSGLEAMGDEILAAAQDEDRDWRRGELIAELAKRLDAWPLGPGRQVAFDGIVELGASLPAGEGLQRATKGLARRVDAVARADLLGASVAGAGDVEAARHVLRAVAEMGDEEEVDAFAAAISELEPELGVRLLDGLANQLRRTGRTAEVVLGAVLEIAAAATEDAVRTMCSHASTAAEIETLRPLVETSTEGARAVQYGITLGARADRAGEQDLAQALFAAAAARVPDVEDAVRQQKLVDKLALAQGRLDSTEWNAAVDAHLEPRPDRATAPTLADAPVVAGASAGEPGPASEPAAPVRRAGVGERQAAAAPAAPVRQVLALVDTYEGAIGRPHLTALSRAAGLAVGFDLDILLVDWPTEQKLGRLVTQVAGESGTAGATALGDLLAAGRVKQARLSEVLDDAMPHGFPVATAHEVDASRDPSSLPPTAPLCLLIGLGRKGLPKRARQAPHALDVTGRGASLETAAAMGALAHWLSMRSR